MCWSFRANCHKKLNNYEDALKDSMKSIELDSRVHELTHLRVVNCHLLFGNITEAQEAIKVFLKLFPTRTRLVEDPMNKLKTFEDCDIDAQKHFESNDYTECLYYINQMLEIAPECSRLKEMKQKCLTLGRIPPARLVVLCSSKTQVIAPHLDKKIRRKRSALVVSEDIEMGFDREKTRQKRKSDDYGNRNEDIVTRAKKKKNQQENIENV